MFFLLSFVFLLLQNLEYKKVEKILPGGGRRAGGEGR
jgi:hypothetical protein